MTTGARLAELSGLSGVSAATHLLAIRLSGATAGAMLVSRSTLSTGTAIAHLAGGGVSSASASYSQEVNLTRKWYVRRKKRIFVFSTGQEADAFIEAEAQAQQLAAAKTSRLARKRVLERVYKLADSVIDVDQLGALVQRLDMPVDLPALIDAQDYQQLMRVMAWALEQQDEDDIEMLLLA